jgi:hypothetical protein
MTDTGVIITSEDYRKTRTRAVLDYTSRDFAAIRAQLVGLAKGFMPEWETAGESGDMGTLILELFAYMGDVMHFYIDRTASEGFLGTAVRRQSILYIADMLGYKPIGQQSASVALQFSMDARAAQVANPNSPDPNFSVTLPSGTRITNGTNSTAGQIIFELDTSVVLRPGDTGVTAYATEGVLLSDQSVGISKGTPNATFLLPDKGIVFGTVRLVTREGGNVVEWSALSDISLARPTQSAFTTYLDDDGRTYLVFGDNAAGRIPPFGAELFVTYRFGVGAAANNLDQGALSTLVPPTGVDTWGITVSNASAPVGGADPETVESMRYSIPRAAGRLKNRAVTLNDYADLALQVPGVAKAIAHGTLYTAVYVRIAPVGGQADDSYMARLIAAVEDHLSDKVLVGSQVYAEPESLDDIWLNTFLRVTVHVQTAYNRTQVRQVVEDSIRALFAFDNVDFGSRITIGQVYRTVLSVQGVEWAEVKWMNSSAPVNTTIEIEIDTDDDNRIVSDIHPDDLHIVRIDATEVIETEANFPALNLEERTHDGLWVKADGGLVNT